MLYQNAKELFDKIEINLTQNMFDNFNTYQKELIEWNNNINLTTITEDNEVWLKHFVDSCTISKYIKENDSVIDVGTGAGFPGIPVRIIKDIKITLLDSLNKRINFLNEVCDKCNLKDVNTVHGRAEDFGKDKKHREQYDIATARAVANLSTLLEYCLPFVKVNGSFICMKSSDCDEEINDAKYALEELGGKIEIIEDITLPDSDIKRKIIVIKKTKPTPSKYPRKAGIPAKQPIA